METDATEWEIAKPNEREIAWIKAGELNSFESASIVRFRNESTGRFSRLIARLHRVNNRIVCRSARSLHYHECSRLLTGIRLMAGLPRELHGKNDGGQISLALSCYALPEIMTAFTAIYSNRLKLSGQRVKFTFLATDVSRVISVASFFGFKLILQQP